MVTIDREPIKEKEKSVSAFKRFMYAVFVHNFGFKALSLLLSTALFIIATTL